MLFPDVATILWQHLKDERSRLYLPSIKYNNEATQIFRNKFPLSILSNLSEGYVLVFVAVLVSQFVHSPRHLLFPDTFSKDF